MASIKAKLSSIELYTSNCGDDYSLIINLANDILSRSEKLYIWVQEESEKISRQVVRANRAYDEISDKVDYYTSMMEDAKDEIESYTDEIEYLHSHPTTITTTDDDGNETTQEVLDYAAIRTAERARDAARSTYDSYRDKRSEANIVHRETGYLVSKFENTKRGIETVSRSIQNDIYEVKKFIKAIEEEAEFNLHSLQGVINSLQYYLSSKAIFMPDGSYYEEFASAKVGEKSFSNSKTTQPYTLFTQDDLVDSTPEEADVLDKLELYKEVHSAKEYSERKYLKQSQKAAENISWECRKAFENYSGVGHKLMNQYLRGKNPEFTSQNQKEITEQHISHMTEFINTQTLPHSMVLYRGVSTIGDFIQDKDWRNKSLEVLRAENINKIKVDSGFCSTSIFRDSADDFKQSWNGTMVEITAPKGANAMFMQNVSVYGYEKEVLLQKGSAFRITSIDYNPSGGYIIKAELVGRM